MDVNRKRSLFAIAEQLVMKDDIILHVEKAKCKILQISCLEIQCDSIGVALKIIKE